MIKQGGGTGHPRHIKIQGTKTKIKITGAHLLALDHSLN